MSIALNLDGTMLGTKATIEYYSWKRVVKVLRDLKVEINDHDELNSAILDYARAYHEYRLDRERFTKENNMPLEPDTRKINYTLPAKES